MDRRRKHSLQEQLYARERVLADIKEKEEARGAEASIPEESQDLEIQDSDCKRDEELPFLHRVVADGNLELLTQLVENGTDINVRDREGWPPLHTAIKTGKSECATFLLKHGAGDIYFELQKAQYMKRLQTSKKTRRKSHWM
ncbi:ankyrin repeat domain-containing protein 49 [Nematostella vectensis]|uniref:ankyrin repeat domain-containing protein 49 n=1 Tax=Nematostella vectensis TaxID=45351 RepID=UPI002076E324|nr:ankyrin repeat domain-containing protein 49 [Nematostella vectensis]